jgi:hypothetical protein
VRPGHRAARWHEPPTDDAPPGVVPVSPAPALGRPERVSRLLPRLRWPRLRWYQEILAVIAGDFLYEVIRASAPQKAAEAFHNAALLTALEPGGVRAAEAWMRDTTAGSTVLTYLFGGFYNLFHLSVTAGVLIWLWLRRPDGYARARTALFALTFGGLLIFWVFPVAPPRLVTPEAINALGTPAMAALDGEGGISGAVGSLVNPYAAFPSLHVGWAAWCAWAVWAHLRGRRRWIAWLYPLTTVIVVVGTSNHYFIDVVGGLLVVLLAVLI